MDLKTFEEAEDAIEAVMLGIAAQVMKNYVKRICNEFNLRYAAGLGTYGFWSREGPLVESILVELRGLEEGDWFKVYGPRDRELYWALKDAIEVLETEIRPVNLPIHEWTTDYTAEKP